MLGDLYCRCLLPKKQLKGIYGSARYVCVWNFCVFNFSPFLPISVFPLPSLNIIVKQRDYLYLQLNANFIQAFKQNHIHSLNQMIPLFEKIYQHMAMWHPAYKGLQLSVSAEVYYFIIKRLNYCKRCLVTVNALVNLIMPIKKEFNSIAATESYAWQSSCSVLQAWSCPGRAWIWHGGEAGTEEMNLSVRQWSQVNTMPQHFQTLLFLSSELPECYKERVLISCR